MTRALDKAAYDTGALTVSSELLPTLFGATTGVERAGLLPSEMPGAARAADMARGAIAESIALLACIDGVFEATAFVTHALRATVTHDGVTALGTARKD